VLVLFTSYEMCFLAKIIEWKKPGCMGKILGRSQNSRGSGLQPDHSYTPSTYT
jgi:hypothetical protein